MKSRRQAVDYQASTLHGQAQLELPWRQASLFARSSNAGEDGQAVSCGPVGVTARDDSVTAAERSNCPAAADSQSAELRSSQPGGVGQLETAAAPSISAECGNPAAPKSPCPALQPGDLAPASAATAPTIAVQASDAETVRSAERPLSGESGASEDDTSRHVEPSSAGWGGVSPPPAVRSDLADAPDQHVDGQDGGPGEALCYADPTAAQRYYARRLLALD